MKMPTQLNRLFRLYASGKKVPTENKQPPSRKGGEPMRRDPKHSQVREPPKASRHSKNSIRAKKWGKGI